MRIQIILCNRHIRYSNRAVFRGVRRFAAAGTADRLSGSVARRVHDKLKGQIVVAIGGDSDNITAFQNGNRRICQVIILRKCQRILICILFI